MVSGDPNHTTTHTYSSSYAGAYPTQTCSPTVNNITRCVSGTYDLNTGLLASFTDANSQTSSYGYDNKGRMASASFPDGGQTSFCYSDTMPDGSRVEKTTGGSNPTGTIYWYISPGIVAESDLPGTLKI
jgi:YD repeat-containing protein